MFDIWCITLVDKNLTRFTCTTSKCVAFRSWATLHPTWWRLRNRFRTLEIDSGYKNRNIGFYPKSIDYFWGFYALMTIIQIEGASLRSARTPTVTSLRFTHNQSYLRFDFNFCSQLIVAMVCVHDLKSMLYKIIYVN